jgi:hypothetical protein
MQVTIDLSPTLQSQLSEQATQLNIPIEALILQAINQYTQTPQPHLDPNYDPITPLIGTLKLGSSTADQPTIKYRQAGSLQGKITMAPDFDAPLEDLKDYM